MTDRDQSEWFLSLLLFADDTPEKDVESTSGCG